MNKETQWNELEKKLINFIHSKLLIEYGNLDDYNDDVELVDSKILSSLALINLLAGIEDILGSEIVNDDVGIEDFSTVNKIIHSVKKSYNRI